MSKLFRYGSVLLFMAALLFSSAVAQDLMLKGKVISEDTGEGLPGANVLVEGTLFGATTDLDGNFEIRVPNTSNATLVVNYVGYKEKKADVTGSSENLLLSLDEDIIRGSEVVVTGLASSVKRENLANSVGSITAQDLIPAPAQTIESAMTAKVAGLSVSQNTGAPGGGIYVNLRGVSTIEGSVEPLYIVDGMIVNNEAIQNGADLVTEAASAGSTRPQGQPTNRIADINPADIESVEILKGSSAAAIYGSKASNGVIIITTKKGQAGETRIDVNQRNGFSSILRKIGTRTFTEVTARQQGGDAAVEQFRRNGNIDYEDEMYGETGFLNETSLSVRGGSSRTQFFVSGLFRDEEGIIKNSGYQKLSAKLNLNHQFSNNLKLDTYTTFVRSESDRGLTGNDNTFTTFGFALGFTPAYVDLRPKNGDYPDGLFSNPLHTRDVLINNELVNRTMNSAKLTWTLLRNDTQNLDFIFQGGVDFFSQNNSIFSPPELQFERSSDQPGTSVTGETRGLNTTGYVSLAHLYSTPSSILFKTSAGLQFENQEVDNTLVQAQDVIPGQQNVDQGASNNIFQNIDQQYDRGFFFQEEVDLKGSVYLTAGVRADASSANGDPDKFHFYPKASASLRLSQLAFWEGLKSISDEFKIRAAYGETGNVPIPRAKYSSFLRENIGGEVGLIPATSRGNPDIEPERTREIEVGFDAALFNGLAGLEFSFYTQTITDLLLETDLPPSSGFSSKWINGGEMRTQGFEVMLNASPIKTELFRWNPRVIFYKTSSEITKLDVDPFNKGGFATSLGTYRIEEGKSPTTIIGLDEDGNVVEYGDETPDFELSMNNGFQIGNFDVSFLFHWKNGGEIINLGRFITDLGGTTEDYDAVKIPVRDPETSDIIGYTTSRLASGSTDPWIEDGTYVKLREAAISYTFAQDKVPAFLGGTITYLKLGLSGRNLLVFTDYTGYDPEVSQFGSVAIGRSVDTIPFPSSRSFYFNLSFGL